MNNISVRETYVNETEGHGIGASDWYETFTDDMGELFRAMRSEYGGCSSLMYRDRRARPLFTAFGVVVTRPGATMIVGWVFGNRQRYEDATPPYTESDYYRREVWVETDRVRRP